MINAGVLRVCAAHFLTLSRDPTVVLDTLTTLTRLIHFVPCFIDMIVETEELSNLVESLPLILFDEEKGKVLLDFLMALLDAPSGVGWIRKNRILDTLQSFQNYKECDSKLAHLIQVLIEAMNAAPFLDASVSKSQSQSSHSLQSLQNSQNMQSLQNSQNMQSLQNSQNMQSLQTSQTSQTSQNSQTSSRQSVSVPLSWSDRSELQLDAEKVSWSTQTSFLSFCLHCLLDDSMSHYIPAIFSVLEDILINESRHRWSNRG